MDRAEILLANLATALVLGLWLTSCASAQAADQGFRIKVGANNPVCIVGERLLRRIPAKSFTNGGDWRNWFENSEDWEQRTTLLLRRDGTTVPFEFSYVSFDIDNDGDEDILVWRTSMMSSAQIDLWYLFALDQLPRLLDATLPVDLLLSVPAVKGYAASTEQHVPTDFARWSLNGVNYIAMREFGFPGKRDVPSSFLVGKYDGRVVKRGGDGPTAQVTVVCEIR
jgi:hypothetical protein